MATSEAGRGVSRRTVSVAGQYLVLVLLAVVVLAPLLLTVIQAMSPPFLYVEAGKPPGPQL